MFNRKELDYETGLYYYGARYYDPKVSLWLNTDPLSGYNPIQEVEHYIDGQHNGGVFNFGNLNTYTYTYQNPVVFIDPNGKQTYFIHGTWTDPSTFKTRTELNTAVNRAFGNEYFDYNFIWSGYNTSGYRTLATNNLVYHIYNTHLKNSNEPITLVGQSHGGNVSIDAINILVEMPVFKDREINLMTINTPVRPDYQLSDKAKERVNHINIYDMGDIVQVSGGNSSFTKSSINSKTGKPYPPGSRKYTGESGNAGRTFDNALNIKTSQYNGIIIGDEMHNSHNQVDGWINQIPNINEK